MKTEFEEQLEETKKAVKSGTSAVHLCGDDYNRIDEFVTTLAKDYLDFTEYIEENIRGEIKKIPRAAIVEWNYGYGQIDFYTRKKIPSPYKDEKMSFPQFLERYKDPNLAESHVILIRNARHVLDGEMNRENLAQLQQTIVHLKKNKKGKAVLIYCDEKRFIPDELTSLVYFLDVKPPSLDELIRTAEEFIKRKEENEKKFAKDHPDSVRNQFSSIDPKLARELSSMCVGMSKDSFNQILEKAALEEEKDFNEAVKPWAEKTKKQYVEKTGLLKFVNAEVDIDNDVGGLGYLKWWLRRNEKAFKHPKEAKEIGISPAKGILLVGMPGCGKSLTSKAVAAFFGYPLLALDLGTLMGKYLGESEGNLRRAISLAENSSPCVLWVDEIEKAFAGVGGDESGVSQRLLGYLLTWLNDKKSQVFVMATANDVAVLPPEFLRRGRFDEIFYVDFPNERERKEIFKIHIGKVFGKNIVKKMEEGELKEKLEREKISKEKYIEKLGKEEFDKAIKNNEKIKNDFDELTRDKKREDKKKDGKIEKPKVYIESEIEALVNATIDKRINNPSQDKKPEDKEKDENVILEDEKTYQGTEGYAGSDIEALVNAAVIRFWNKENNEETIENSIFSLLLSERKFMTPLKEVLAEKIKINREKFGKYKLTSASFTKENLKRFEDASEGDEKQQLEIAKEEICPPGILIKLAKNGSKNVKLAVLENLSCPPTCVIDLMGDGDADVKAKAEEKQLATPAGIIKIAQNGTPEQKLNLFKLNREIPEEALVSLANNGNIEIIKALKNYRSDLPKPVWTALIARGKDNEEINKLIPEEQKYKLVDDKVCLNCYYRKGTSNMSCKYGKPCGISSKCEDWKESYENYCVWCLYNDGEKCTKQSSFMDNCLNFTIPKKVKPSRCSECEYVIINKAGKKECKFNACFGLNYRCPIKTS
ncbi:hypothetical protein R84B8_01108 [Treponema sp. R8-4-B8]